MSTIACLPPKTIKFVRRIAFSLLYFFVLFFLRLDYLANLNIYTIDVF